MRLTLITLTLFATVSTAAAQSLRTDGPVAGGIFGISGSDYFGDIHDGSFEEVPVVRRPASKARQLTARPALRRLLNTNPIPAPAGGQP